MPKQSGIYKIANSMNGKIYVGSAADIHARWCAHRCFLRKGTHINRKLQNAWLKYGADAFEFSIIELCPPSELASREQHWMDALAAASEDGYNLNPKARTNLGNRLSLETRLKIAAKARGRKMSPEYRLRLSVERKGMKQSPEGIRKRAALMTGFRHSEESRKKMRAIALARPANTTNVVQAIAANRGKKQTPEHIAKRVKAHLGAKRSEATKLLLSTLQFARIKSNPPPKDQFGRLVKWSPA